MTLTTQLAKLTQKTCEHLSAQEVGILQRTTQLLRRSDILERSLQVGESVPDFSWKHNDKLYTFYDMLPQGPVIINFFRGFWCSFCREELSAYESILQQLHQAGYQYLSISPDSNCPESQANSDNNITDLDNKIAHQFGIVHEIPDEQKALFARFGLNLAEAHHSEVWELPIPATYIVQKDRTVSERFIDPDYRKRLDPEFILDHIK